MTREKKIIDNCDEEPDEDDPEEEAEEEGVQVETDDGVPAEMEQLAPNQPASDGDDELDNSKLGSTQQQKIC